MANSRRLFSTWRITPFDRMAAAVVSQRLFKVWQRHLPFRLMSLADFSYLKKHFRRASFLLITLMRFFQA